ncbi:sensor histidine kinase [Zunongwangia sp.]|uniref:sensor histidine kinase n=1 Tax=Zunongwangia sp. TaxID=1965325 RepID=UPI003AA97B3A
MQLNIFSLLFLFFAEIGALSEQTERATIYNISSNRNSEIDLVVDRISSISMSFLAKAVPINKIPKASNTKTYLNLYDSVKNYFIITNQEDSDASRKQNITNQLQRDRLIILGLTLCGVTFTIFFMWRIHFYKQKQRLTDQLQNQNEVITKQNELISERNKDLYELDQHKNKLFSILSHDLKSPLAAIQQLLELMKTEDFSEEEFKSVLDDMLLQVSATSTMLKNLLHWASSQMEGSNLAVKKIALINQVSNIIEAYRLVVKSKNINIVHKKSDNLSNIYFDEAHLNIILQNIISNAIKFSPLNKNIEIYYKETPDVVKLIVKDNGRGISSEKIEKIKNAKSKMISEVGTKMELGTGLGMLVVNQFLSMNQGILDIKSEIGKGSEFIISFQKKPFE